MCSHDFGDHPQVFVPLLSTLHQDKQPNSQLSLPSFPPLDSLHLKHEWYQNKGFFQKSLYLWGGIDDDTVTHRRREWPVYSVQKLVKRCLKLVENNKYICCQNGGGEKVVNHFLYKNLNFCLKFECLKGGGNWRQIQKNVSFEDG